MEYLILPVWIVGLLSPYLAGPAAASLFISTAKKGELSLLHLVLIPMINLASFAIILMTFGHTGFGPGDIAVLTSPFYIVASFLKLVFSKKSVDRAAGDDLKRKRYYAAGMILIPLLQLLTMIGAWRIWVSIE